MTNRCSARSGSGGTAAVTRGCSGYQRHSSGRATVVAVLGGVAAVTVGLEGARSCRGRRTAGKGGI